MTPKTNLKLVSRILVRWLFGLSLTMGTLFAQSTGTITGRVFDQATGRSLQGAVVHIKGSTASDFTDTEGRFTLSGVPAGAATVEIEYVGLDSVNQLITVAPGEAARLDVERTARGLVLRGLDLVRDARMAWIDAEAAKARAVARKELAVTWQHVAKIARARPSTSILMPLP